MFCCAARTAAKPKNTGKSATGRHNLYGRNIVSGGNAIGNLNDLSPRAIETLKSVDFIAAEDTRVTLKLLNHFGIRRPLISYYEHNKVESAAVILPRLLGGESCALVSDAGMPAISDPGEELVRLCGEHGITVSAAPGPSAVITALGHVRPADAQVHV